MRMDRGLDRAYLLHGHAVEGVEQQGDEHVGPPAQARVLALAAREHLATTQTGTRKHTVREAASWHSIAQDCTTASTTQGDGYGRAVVTCLAEVCEEAAVDAAARHGRHAVVFQQRHLQFRGGERHRHM